MTTATYKAIFLFPEGREGRYEFSAPATFIENAPARVLDRFLSSVEGLDLPTPMVDSEINAAQRFPADRTITGSGSVKLRDGAEVPFIAMIQQSQDS